jgi:hypothetical protein
MSPYGSDFSADSQNSLAADAPKVPVAARPAEGRRYSVVAALPAERDLRVVTRPSRHARPRSSEQLCVSRLALLRPVEVLRRLAARDLIETGI